ncbi:hypothetical protein D3C72_552190 [compost metagenome]
MRPASTVRSTRPTYSPHWKAWQTIAVRSPFSTGTGLSTLVWLWPPTIRSMPGTCEASRTSSSWPMCESTTTKSTCSRSCGTTLFSTTAGSMIETSLRRSEAIAS